MSKSRNNRRAALNLEPLAGRVMPAVLVTQLDLDHDGQADDIQILGDANKNNVVIHDNGVDTLTISVDADGNGVFTDPGDLNNATFTYSGRLEIDARLGAAKDSFSYDLTAPLVSRVRDLNVAMGAGNDKVSITAGDLNSSILGGAQLDANVYGGAGHDTVDVKTGKVFGSEVGIRMDLGAGNDHGSVTMDRIDNKASVDVAADLGDGANVFALDLQSVGFSDQANATVDIVGGIDVDTVVANLHDDVGGGVTPSHLTINADLGAGNDIFAANLDYAGNVFRVDDYSTTAIHVRGGAGDDTLVAQGIGATGTIRIDPNALLDIDLKGGAGNDTVVVNLGKTDALELIGGIKVRMDGGVGNDTMGLLLANNANTTGNYDVALNAGAGDDTVSFALDLSTGTPTFSPKPFWIDGGQGNDTLTDGNKSNSSENGFETIN